MRRENPPSPREALGQSAVSLGIVLLEMKLADMRPAGLAVPTAGATQAIGPSDAPPKRKPRKTRGRMSERVREKCCEAAWKCIDAAGVALGRGDTVECDCLLERGRALMRVVFPSIGAYAADADVRAAYWRAHSGHPDPEPAVAYPNPYTPYAGYGPDQNDAGTA